MKTIWNKLKKLYNIEKINIKEIYRVKDSTTRHILINEDSTYINFYFDTYNKVVEVVISDDDYFESYIRKF